MLRQDTIAQNLLGIVGWRKSADDSCVDTLPEAPTETRSGLVVQDLNELLSTRVIRHIVPEGELLADWLERITLDTTRKLVNALVLAQGIPSKSLATAAPLLNGQGSLSNTVNPLGRFVGYRLNLRPDYKGTRTTVPRIGLQVDNILTAPLPIYVYSTGQAAPVKVLQLQNTRRGYTHWLETAEAVDEVTTDLDISFAAGTETAYIGYYEDELAARGARAVQRDFGHTPCTCANDPYQGWGQLAWPRSISVPADAVQEDRTLWGPNEAVLETQSFGLNLELSVLCDIVTTLSSEENQGRIAEALQLALAIRVLHGIVGTSTITQLTAREDVQADALALLYTYQARLYGGKDMGTDNFYPSLLKTVQLDLSGLCAQCQPQPADRVGLGYMSSR